jgi:hypothetical protein
MDYIKAMLRRVLSFTDFPSVCSDWLAYVNACHLI